MKMAGNLDTAEMRFFVAMKILTTVGTKVGGNIGRGIHKTIWPKSQPTRIIEFILISQ